MVLLSTEDKTRRFIIERRRNAILVTMPYSVAIVSLILFTEHKHLACRTLGAIARAITSDIIDDAVDEDMRDGVRRIVSLYGESWHKVGYEERTFIDTGTELIGAMHPIELAAITMDAAGQVGSSPIITAVLAAWNKSARLITPAEMISAALGDDTVQV